MMNDAGRAINPPQSARGAADPKAAVQAGGDRAHQVIPERRVLHPQPGSWLQRIKTGVCASPCNPHLILKCSPNLILTDPLGAAPVLPLVIANPACQPRTSEADPNRALPVPIYTRDHVAEQTLSHAEHLPAIACSYRQP